MAKSNNKKNLAEVNEVKAVETKDSPAVEVKAVETKTAEISLDGIVLEDPSARLANVSINFGKIKGKIDQEKKARWLKKAMVRDGKYIVQVEYYAGMESNPNLHPVYYVVNTDFTKTRIGLEVAHELYSTGKVEGEMDNADFETLQKISRKAKAGTKKTKAVA